MNTVGIDFARSFSVLGVREGAGPRARFVSVGDGWRRLVPNAVGGDDRWGTQAFSVSVARCFGGDRLEAGPWLDAPEAAQFWRCLARRLYDFLGRTEPIRENGYQVVVALSHHGFARGREVVRQLASAAGLKDLTCVTALDAILHRWAMERSSPDNRECTVAVVNVADTVCDVGVRRVRVEGRGRPRDVAAGTVVSLPHTGWAWWIRRIEERVQARLREPLPIGNELLLRDAAIDFGMAFGRAGMERTVEWAGPFRELMHSPPFLGREECRLWPEVANLEAELPDAIRRSLRSLGLDRADVALIGGVGAAFPFAAASIEGVCPVWQSSDPVEDVALGATLCGPSVSPLDGSPEESSVAGAELPEPFEAAPRCEQRPPWERRQPTDE